MELRQLELLVAVAEEGSIHGAARRLMLAQPSVSQALRKLESGVGAPLLVRSSRGIELTRAGEVLVARAREILERVDDTLAEVRGEARRRPLRIGLVCGRMAAAELTSSIVSTFRRRRSDLDVSVVELSFSDQVEALTTGAVDVAIVRPPYDDDSISLTPLFAEPRMVCFATDHHLADADHLELDDVLTEPVHYLTRAPRAWARFWGMDEARDGEGQAVDNAAVTVSELQMTLTGQRGLMSVSSSGWRMGMATPWLRAVPIDGLSPTEVAVGVAPRSAGSDTAAFAACARAVCEGMIDVVPGAQII